MTAAAHREGWRVVPPDGSAAIDLESLQGLWTETQYLRLTDHLRRLLEFTDGRLEVLPMPTDRHQVISRFLFLALFPSSHDSGLTMIRAMITGTLDPACRPTGKR